MLKRTIALGVLSLGIIAQPAFAHDEMLLEDRRLQRLVNFLGDECYTDVMVHRSWFGRVIIEAYRDDEQVREIVVDLKSGRFLRDRVDDWGRRSWRANHYHDWDERGERSEHQRPPRDSDRADRRGDRGERDGEEANDRGGRGPGFLGHGGILHGRHPHKIALSDICLAAEQQSLEVDGAGEVNAEDADQ